MTDFELIVGTLLVKPALVLAVTALVVAGMRRQSAAARHVVWAVAIIGTLALPFMWIVLPPLPVPVLTRGLGPSPAQFIAPEAGESGSGASANGTPAPSATDPAAQRADGPTVVAVLSTAILRAWLLVALLLGGARVVAELRVRRIVERARPPANPHVTRLFHRAARQSGIDALVDLRVSDDITSPVVAGLLHPVVLLPVAAEEWAERDLAPILVHELSHVARHDGIVNLLADVAAALYWCNPAVRCAVRRMRTECERACDDRVLRAGTVADEYADVLLRVAAATRANGALTSPAIPMVRLRELESRLHAILDPRVSRSPLPARKAALFAVLIGVITLPAAALTPARPLPTPAHAQELPEPDQRGDSVAAPASERLPLGTLTFRAPPEALAALRGPDSALVRRLIEALGRQPTHDADFVRERAAWALAHARDGRLVEPLLDALHASDWRVQAYAAWALATARDPRAVPPLVPLLAHPIWRLRAMAAYALRVADDPRAEAAMHRALTDPAWQVRVEAVHYFAMRGEPALSDRLTPRLADRHVAVRNAAARALHR